MFTLAKPLGVVVYMCYHSIGEADVGGSIVGVQPGLHREFPDSLG